MADVRKCENGCYERPPSSYCYVCLSSQLTGFVEQRRNLWPEAIALVHAAGLDPAHVGSIEVTPKEVRFTIHLKDENGKAYLCGDGLATGTIIFPSSPPDAEEDQDEE